MPESARVKVLCVDDEPHVLAALSLQLRRRYEVFTAPGGAAGLEVLRDQPGIAVVVSDMRMPGMDGATFLSRTRQAAPQAVRILLTGQADFSAAVSAVNEGQLFRFLSKPCPPPALMTAIEAAAEQHRLLTAERVLLEETLHGSIKALTDVLALTNPVSFGRAVRIKQRVSELAARLAIPDRWQVEVAAMLSQLGTIALPADTVEKVYYGKPLTDDERAMVERIPAVTEQLLGSIPRLEVVRAIIGTYTKALASPTSKLPAAQSEVVKQGAQVLQAAAELDALEAQAHSPESAFERMLARAERYDAAVLAALQATLGTKREREEIRELSLSALQVGMVLAEDVKLLSGALLAARGYEVTQGFVERARNFRHNVVTDRVRVVVARAENAECKMQDA